MYIPDAPNWVGIDRSDQMVKIDYSEDMVQYRYYASPAVSHVVPSSGPTEGGTVISVYGRNFIDSDSLNCRFGNDSVVSGRWVSSDRVECEMPALSAGGCKY